MVTCSDWPDTSPGAYLAHVRGETQPAPFGEAFLYSEAHPEEYGVWVAALLETWKREHWCPACLGQRARPSFATEEAFLAWVSQKLETR